MLHRNTIASGNRVGYPILMGKIVRGTVAAPASIDAIIARKTFPRHCRA